MSSTAALAALHVTAPPADWVRPSPQNLFRLRGVHYFQDEWPFTFWDNLDPARLDGDFAEIRRDGFNTIILFLGWGTFQTRVKPVTYDDRAYAKLDEVIAHARKSGLWVILRVGTPEHVPSDLPNSSPYDIPDLMFSPEQVRWLSELFLETSKRAAKHQNVFGMFHSWEDFSQYLHHFSADEKTRLEFENRGGMFRNYLRSRGPIEKWNAKWGTQYASFKEVPVPAAATPPLADYIDFIAQFVNESILKEITVAPGTALGYEVRLDKESVAADHSRWHGYSAGFSRLPPQYTFVCGYYNPYWGAPNDGGFITPDDAARSAAIAMGAIKQSTDAPLFVDQLNLADDTPRFTRSNSKLRYPDDEAAAARLIVPTLFRSTIGYSLWTYKDYVGNIVGNSAFQEQGVWKTEGDVSYVIEDARRRAVLAPGSSVVQPFAFQSPGAETTAAYRFDLRAGSEDATATSRLELTIEQAEGGPVSVSIDLRPGPRTWYQVSLPQLAGKRLTRITLHAVPSNRSRVVVEKVSFWNHLMATGLFDRDGVRRASRTDAYRAINADWERYEHGDAFPAAYDTRLDCTRSACLGVHADRWIGRSARLPIYVPSETGMVAIELDVPPQLPSGAQINVQWEDAPAIVTVAARSGTVRVALPIAPDARGRVLGDRHILIKTSASFRIPPDERDLSILLRSVAINVAPLELSKPLCGLAVAEVKEPLTNRVLVRGKLSGAAPAEIYFHLRGHKPQKLTLERPGEWTASLALSTRDLAGKRELFLESHAKAGAVVTVDAVTGESARGPNDIYQ